MATPAPDGAVIQLNSTQPSLCSRGGHLLCLQGFDSTTILGNTVWTKGKSVPLLGRCSETQETHGEQPFNMEEENP